MVTDHIKRAFKAPSLEFLVLIIAIIAVIIFQALPGAHPLDDSYITFRYARNIHAGMGFVYNPGEPVQGTTTPLYTLILVLFSFLFGSVNLPNISFGIALFADVINTWLLFRIAKHLLKQNVFAFVLAIVFLLQPQRLSVATGGMETSLFITMLLAMYDCYLIGKNNYVAAIFGALAILIRPDAILAVGPVFIHLLWKNRSIAVKALLLGIAILFPWYVWATWYFGNPIPFSVFAKMVAYQSYTPGETLTLILTFLGTGTVGPYKNQLVIFPGLIVTIFLIIIGVRWIWKNNQESLIVVAFPFLYFLIMTIRHAPLFFSWYYLPLMPGLLILFFCAFFQLFPGQPQKSTRQKTLLGSFALALLLFPAVLMLFLPGWANSREIENLYKLASASIHDQADNKLVFAPDIGVIGWELENSRILDPIGLVSPISLKYMEEFHKFDLVQKEMIKDLKPDFVIAQEWFIFDLTKDSDFLTDYQLFRQINSQITTTQNVIIYKRK